MNLDQQGSGSGPLSSSGGNSPDIPQVKHERSYLNTILLTAVVVIVLSLSTGEVQAAIPNNPSPASGTPQAVIAQEPEEKLSPSVEEEISALNLVEEKEQQYKEIIQGGDAPEESSIKHYFEDEDTKKEIYLGSIQEWSETPYAELIESAFEEEDFEKMIKVVKRASYEMAVFDFPDPNAWTTATGVNRSILDTSIIDDRMHMIVTLIAMNKISTAITVLNTFPSEQKPALELARILFAASYVDSVYEPDGSKNKYSTITNSPFLREVYRYIALEIMMNIPVEEMNIDEKRLTLTLLHYLRFYDAFSDLYIKALKEDPNLYNNIINTYQMLTVFHNVDRETGETIVSDQLRHSTACGAYGGFVNFNDAIAPYKGKEYTVLQIFEIIEQKGMKINFPENFDFESLNNESASFRSIYNVPGIIYEVYKTKGGVIILSRLEHHLVEYNENGSWSQPKNSKGEYLKGPAYVFSNEDYIDLTNPGLLLIVGDESYSIVSENGELSIVKTTNDLREYQGYVSGVSEVFTNNMETRLNINKDLNWEDFSFLHTISSTLELKDGKVRIIVPVD